jgi:hypothetical protein
VLPSENVTAPEGAVDPPAGLTTAANTVLPVVSRLAGVAVKLTAVEMGGEVTEIETAAVEFPKLPVAV